MFYGIIFDDDPVSDDFKLLKLTPYFNRLWKSICYELNTKLSYVLVPELCILIKARYHN
jgi:hypothetical protein